MQDLERYLRKLGNEASNLIITDDVFSMEGDLANLPEIIRLAEKYDAQVMVDDAHGIGVLGENGRGTAEHFGVEDQVDLIMGTFSKSFASRPLVFTASMTPSSAGAALKALEIIESESEKRSHLLAISDHFRQGLKKLGLTILDGMTPVIPVFVGDMEKTFLACKLLFDQGIYVNPVVAPAVAPDATMIRTSLTATHTFEQIDRALEVFTIVGKKLGLIS